MQSNEAKSRVFDKLLREMGRDILSSLEDPEVIEILLNADGQLWVEKLGQNARKLGFMSFSAAESMVMTIASAAGKFITAENPLLECELPVDGSRFQAVLPPIVAAPVFSIRKRSLRILSLNDYVASEILNTSQANILRQAILERKNILIIGGTGTGKTTFANALIQSITEISPDHRLVVLEDTREINCSAENAVFLRSNELTDMTQLLRATMRLRPDRIIVGEVRGQEALALLKAWNTGHPGGIATVHANHSLAGLIRLERLVGEISEAPMQRLIAEAVNIIVLIEKSADSRKVTSIAEVLGFDGRNYQIKYL